MFNHFTHQTGVKKLGGLETLSGPMILTSNF